MTEVNARLEEIGKPVLALANVVPSSSTPTRVSLKGYQKLTAFIFTTNGATGITGSAITLKQATNVGNTNSDEKAVAFTNVAENLDTGATDTLVDTAVSSNTFTTDATASKNQMYVLTVRATDLDINNGFDCVRIGAGNAVNCTVTIMYFLWPAKYGKQFPLSAILD